MSNMLPTVAYWLEILRIAGIFLLIVVGLVIAALALFADRSRGRRRCPKCWYEMNGVNELVCPECGRAASAEKQLLRTRRHWRRTAVGIFITTSGVALTIDWSRLRNDPWEFVPRWILVRIVAGDLSEAQWQVVFTHVFENPEWGDAGMLVTRSTWPADIPIAVSGCPDRFQLLPHPPLKSPWLKLRLLTTPDGKPGEWIDTPRGNHFAPLQIGLAKPGVNSINVEVKLLGEESRQFWHGVRTLAVNVSGTSAERLKPVTLPNDDAFAAWLSPLIYVGSGQGRVFVNIRNRESIFGRYVALGFRLRVFRDGQPIAAASFAARPVSDFLAALGGWPPDPATAPVEPVWKNDQDPSQIAASVWEVECVADRSLALQDYDWERVRNRQIKASDPPAWTEPTEFWDGNFRVRVTPTYWADPDSAWKGADRAMDLVRERLNQGRPPK